MVARGEYGTHSSCPLRCQCYYSQPSALTNGDDHSFFEGNGFLLSQNLQQLIQPLSLCCNIGNSVECYLLSFGDREDHLNCTKLSNIYMVSVLLGHRLLPSKLSSLILASCCSGPWINRSMYLYGILEYYNNIDVVLKGGFLPAQCWPISNLMSCHVAAELRLTRMRMWVLSKVPEIVISDIVLIIWSGPWFGS